MIMYSATPEIVNCIQTGVGSFKAHKINHNPIREDGPYLIDEFVTKETIRTEVDWNENNFRYPIIKFSNEATQVTKSDYLEEEFENGITRSIVFRHDDLICNEYTETIVDVLKIVKDKEIIIAEDKQSIHLTETKDSIDEMIIQEKELVIVKEDIETPNIATEEIALQSHTIAREQAPVNNSGITILITDVDSSVVEVDYDKKSDIKVGKDKPKPSRVIVKRNKERRRTLETKDLAIEKAKQSRIVKKETVTITKTEKESSKITRKKQPLVVKTSSKSKQTKIKPSNGKMEVTGEESSEVLKLLNTETAGTHDEHIILLTEEKMEISTKEIDIDERIERRVDQSDNKDTTDNVTEIEIVEESSKSMEISKSYGQEEFGFHLYGRKNYDGHFISRVEPGSGAHKAGLKVGDKVIDIEGKSADGMEHGEIVDIIKNSSGPLNIVVRNEIEKLKQAKNNLVLETEGDDSKSDLDFTTMEGAKPKRKQSLPSQNWKEKKKMFKKL